MKVKSLNVNCQLKMSNWEKYLEEIYFNPEHPASFEGPKRLYESVKKRVNLKFLIAK